MVSQEFKRNEFPILSFHITSTF